MIFVIYTIIYTDSLLVYIILYYTNSTILMIALYIEADIPRWMSTVDIVFKSTFKY